MAQFTLYTISGWKILKYYWQTSQFPTIREDNYTQTGPTTRGGLSPFVQICNVLVIHIWVRNLYLNTFLNSQPTVLIFGPTISGDSDLPFFNTWRHRGDQTKGRSCRRIRTSLPLPRKFCVSSSSANAVFFGLTNITGCHPEIVRKPPFWGSAGRFFSQRLEVRKIHGRKIYCHSPFS